MKKTELLDSIESTFEKAGFHQSTRCVSRPSCFDLAVRKKDQLALLKVHVNIGNVSSQDATELRLISNSLSATPIIIGYKTRRKLLEDDTVYCRYNVHAFTHKTLENLVLQGMLPLIMAGPGGYYIEVDGNLIREQRQKLGLSVGKTAEMIGISRRTLYGYEKGMAKASVSTAYKLEWILGVPVAQFVKVFQESKLLTSNEDLPVDVNTAPQGGLMCTHAFKPALQKFVQFGFKTINTRRAPFDFIAQHCENELTFLGGISLKKELNMRKRKEEIVNLSKVLEARPIFITENASHNIDCLSISLVELERVCVLDELVSKLSVSV